MKSYEQRCPVTRSLDVVGDRWTLVIVRDLLDGPRRFQRMRSELVGISPTLLSDRLRHLVAAEVIVATDDGYELTDRGWALAPVIDELGRWGVALMDREHARADEVFHDHFRRLGIRFVLRPEALPDRGCTIGFDVDDEHFIVDVASADEHDRLRIRRVDDAPATPVDASVMATVGSVYAARRGSRSVRALEASGRLAIDGEPAIVAAIRAAISPAPP
ncbi:MAG: helix-turn-helix domain-containing protein [Actinomycetota bacterium]